MNFYDLSAKLRAIEEGTESTTKKSNAELSWTEMSPEQQQAFVAKQKADRAAAAAPVPAELSWTEMSPEQQQAFVAKQKADRAASALGLNECGDMPMGMMGMSSHQGQQDSVTMNVSMNGSGAGGIKDLMSILRNIEQSAEHDHAEPMIAHPHSMDGDVDIVLGTADEDMLSDPDADESYGNSAPGGSDAHTYGIDSVTRKGDDMHSKGDVKRLRVNGGENPLQEALVERLSAMYQEIKEGERTMSRAAKGIKKYGKDGMQALRDAEAEGKDLEPVRAKFNKYR